MKRKIGIIGWKNQAEKLISIVNASESAEISCVFHPSYVPPVAGGTDCFSDLLLADGIMIASPNYTHVPYIEAILNAGYDRCVLCEKPPAANIQELERLKARCPKNVMFVFPLRASTLVTSMKRMLMMAGDPIAFDVRVTHGLAFKSSYADSWRSDATLNQLGVIETVAVHWVDVFNALFRNARITNVIRSNVTGIGSAADTARLTLLSDSATASIFVSYAAPATFDVSVMCSDGLVTYDGASISLRAPRATFDASGAFIMPSVVECEQIPNPFVDGLISTVHTFIENAGDSSIDASVSFETSCETNSIIFDAVETKAL